MPRYQQARTFDIVRSVKGAQTDIRSLQVQNAGVVRKSLNQHTAAINYNPFFWGMDATGWQATAGSFLVASDPPASAPYPYAGLYINDGSGSGALMTSASPHTVMPNMQYTVQAWVNSSATSVQIGFDFSDSSHGFVSGPANPTVTVVANTWTPIRASLLSPATAAYAYPRVGSPSGDSAQTYVQAVTVLPSSIPGAWNDMRPLSNSFVGTISGWYPPQYRLSADGYVDVAGWIKTPPTTGNYNSTAFFTMPSGFRPSVSQASWPITGVADGAASPKVSVNTDGTMVLNFLPTSLAQTQVSIYGRYPLDSSGLILS